MLHAFETDVNNSPYYQTGGIGTATTSDDTFSSGNNTGNGAERWAFIPSIVLPDMPGSPRFRTATAITWMARLRWATSASRRPARLGDWRTILVGGLNAGGRGLRARRHQPDKPARAVGVQGTQAERHGLRGDARARGRRDRRLRPGPELRQPDHHETQSHGAVGGDRHFGPQQHRSRAGHLQPARRRRRLPVHPGRRERKDPAEDPDRRRQSGHRWSELHRRRPERPRPGSTTGSTTRSPTTPASRSTAAT